MNFTDPPAPLGYPILLGVVDNKLLYVWCPYCRRYHRHSWYGAATERKGILSLRQAVACSCPGSPSSYYIGVRHSVTETLELYDASIYGKRWTH